MGSKNGQQKLQQIEQYGYYIDLFATLKVIVNNLAY